MKKIRALIYLLCLIVLVVSPIRADEILEIKVPNTSVIVDKGEIGIIGVVSDNTITEVDLYVNETFKEKVPVNSETFYSLLQLEEGLNMVQVTTSGQQSNKVEIFYETGDTQVPAAYRNSFKNYHMHETLAGVDQCESCHDLESGDFQRLSRGEIECSTEACHATKNSDMAEYVHGPVGAGACIACHNPHGSLNPYELNLTGSPLCYRCHTDKEMAFAQDFIHGPVGGGDCVACHDPHGSENKFQLRALGSQLCFMCHKNNKTIGKFVHGPVAANDCNVCHNPHGSENKYQLEQPGADLCFMCHEAKMELMTKEYVHKPVSEGKCTACHDPHNADFQFMLRKPVPDLCYSCHTDKKEKFDAKYPHPPVKEGRCPECHNSHASDVKFQLREEGSALCFSCHENKKEEFNSKKYQHGPVIQGDCVACHNPHGSENPKILWKYFPSEFYTPFAVEKYELCFGCHQKTLVLDKYTSTLTDFRRGNQNLHFLHVNREKGRTCRACHQVHASNQEKHIRSEVPFSKTWMYQIRYTKKENGGRGVVGCHKPQEYSREQSGGGD